MKRPGGEVEPKWLIYAKCISGKLPPQMGGLFQENPESDHGLKSYGLLKLCNKQYSKCASSMVLDNPRICELRPRTFEAGYN